MANDIAARGKPEMIAIQSALALVLNIILNLIFIPRFNFVGAALASSISYSVMTILLAFTFRRLSGARLRDLFLPSRADLVLWQKAFHWLWPKLRREKLGN